MLGCLAHAGQGTGLDARVERLAQELRCITCQNQSLAESTTPLALDLKRELREGLAAGRSEDELRRGLVLRYGEQVLYRPAVAAHTLPLWLGPVVLLLLGAWVLLRHRQAANAPS